MNAKQFHSHVMPHLLKLNDKKYHLNEKKLLSLLEDDRLYKVYHAYLESEEIKHSNKHLNQFLEYYCQIMSKQRKKTAQEEKKVWYTAVVLDDTSMDLLRSKTSDVCGEECSGWVTSQIGSHGYEQLNHHMTLLPSAANKSKDPALLDLLDTPASLEIVGFGVDHKLGIAAWQVSTDLQRFVQSGNPHITALLQNPAVKPFLASKINNWIPVEPFTVTGTIVEVV